MSLYLHASGPQCFIESDPGPHWREQCFTHGPFGLWGAWCKSWLCHGPFSIPFHPPLAAFSASTLGQEAHLFFSPQPWFQFLASYGRFSVPVSSRNVLLPCAIYFWFRLPLSDFAQCPTISTCLKRWLYVSVTMHDVWSGNEHMGNIGPWTEACMCGGQGTAFSSLFPFTFTWISGMEFGSHGLALWDVKCLHPLSHLASKHILSLFLTLENDQFFFFLRMVISV